MSQFVSSQIMLNRMGWRKFQISITVSILKVMNIWSLEFQVIKLKIMIDKNRNRVIFAESDHEFIDTLFSFLTLPLGTILRLLEKDMVQFGSISRVYASVYSLEPRFLRTSYCKSMLIMPRSASEVQCEKLKLNVDYSENAGKLFNCNSYNPRCKNIFSIAQNTRCFCCARLRQCDRKIKEKEEKRSCGGETVVEVFFKGGAASFMITDDLQVMPASTASLTALFGKLGVSDKSEIEAKTVEVGTQEVMLLPICCAMHTILIFRSLQLVKK